MGAKCCSPCLLAVQNAVRGSGSGSGNSPLVETEALLTTSFGDGYDDELREEELMTEDQIKQLVEHQVTPPA